MSPIVLCIIVTICWALWGIFEKQALKTLHPLADTIIFYIGYGVAGIFTYLYVRVKDIKLDYPIEGVLWCLASVVVCLIGGYAFAYVLKDREVGLVAPFTSLYPALVVIILAILKIESMNFNKLIAIILISIGVYFLGRELY